MYKFRFPVSLGEENPTGQCGPAFPRGGAVSWGQVPAALFYVGPGSLESVHDQPGPLAFEHATLDPKWQLSVSDVASPTEFLLLEGWRSARQRVTVCFFLSLSFK